MAQMHRELAALQVRQHRQQPLACAHLTGPYFFSPQYLPTFLCRQTVGVSSALGNQEKGQSMMSTMKAAARIRMIMTMMTTTTMPTRVAQAASSDLRIPPIPSEPGALAVAENRKAERQLPRLAGNPPVRSWQLADPR
jgi:hypothetical protein